MPSCCPLLAGSRARAVLVFPSHHLKHELKFREIDYVIRSPRSMFKTFCSITESQICLSVRFGFVHHLISNFTNEIVDKSKFHRQRNRISHCPWLAGREYGSVMFFSSHHLKHELGKKLLFMAIGYLMRSPKSMLKTGVGRFLLRKRPDLIWSTVHINETIENIILSESILSEGNERSYPAEFHGVSINS